MDVDGSTFGLPRSWRYMLVAMATLILCSCQSLTPQVGDTKPVGDKLAMETEHAITDDPAPILLDRAPAVEIRGLNGDQMAAARPLGSEEIAAGWATPVDCSCSCCDSGDAGAGDGACSTCPPQALVGPPDEYLCDGGDFNLPAAVRADWTVDGLEPEDAIAHYDTLDGRVVVTPSNRVCVYAPRFAAVRRVENLLAHERRQLIDVAVDETAPASSAEAQPVVTSTQRNAVAINLGERPANLFRGREQAAEYVQLVKSGEFYNTLGAYANLEIVRTGQLDGSEQPTIKRAVQAAIAWNGDQAAQVVFSNRQAVAVVGLKQPGTVFQTDEPGDPRLRLVKLASTSHALPGEEVEFTLRFDSIGDQTVGNVTIVDNLTTRLEYVPNTAKSTVPASFTSVPNGAGSTVLRWEIQDPLQPGAGGVLQFKCRVK
jgi:uncharacterized repeat protein (TIGR01451 family)